MTETTLKSNEIAIDRERLHELLTKIETSDKEIEILYNGVVKLMKVFNLADENGVDTKAFEDGNGGFRKLFKGGSSFMITAASAIAPGPIGKRATREIQESFSFFQDWGPILEKYNEKFKPKK